MELTKTERWVHDFREESQFTADLISDNIDNIELLANGGMESMAVANCLLESERDFKILTCKFDKLGKENFKKITNFCKDNRIDQNVIEVKCDDFFGYRTKRPILKLRKFMVDNCTGNPIVPDGLVRVAFDTDDLFLIYKDDDYDLSNYMKEKNINGVPMFYRHNEELIFSQVIESLEKMLEKWNFIIKNMFNTRGKLAMLAPEKLMKSIFLKHFDVRDLKDVKDYKDMIEENYGEEYELVVAEGKINRNYLRVSDKSHIDNIHTKTNISFKYRDSDCDVRRYNIKDVIKRMAIKEQYESIEKIRTKLLKELKLEFHDRWKKTSNFYREQPEFHDKLAKKYGRR